MRLFCKHKKSDLLSLNNYKEGTILNLQCQDCRKKYSIKTNKHLCYLIERNKKKVSYLEKHILKLEQINNANENIIIELREKLVKNLINENELKNAQKLVKLQKPFIEDSKLMAVRALTQLQTEIVMNPKANISEMIDILLKDMKGE